MVHTNWNGTEFWYDMVEVVENLAGQAPDRLERIVKWGETIKLESVEAGEQVVCKGDCFLAFTTPSMTEDGKAMVYLVVVERDGMVDVYSSFERVGVDEIFPSLYIRYIGRVWSMARAKFECPTCGCFNLDKDEPTDEKLRCVRCSNEHWEHSVNPALQNMATVSQAHASEPERNYDECLPLWKLIHFRYPQMASLFMDPDFKRVEVVVGLLKTTIEVD